MQSTGWISLVDGSAITTTVPLSGLAGTDADDGGGNILPGAVFRLTWVTSAETSSGNTITGNFGVTPSAGSAIFTSGGNGDSSQTLTAFTDTYTAAGGSVGKTAERSFTVFFSTSGMTTADSIDLSFGLTAHNAFYFVDDIELLVNPSTVVAPAVAADPATVLTSFAATVGGEVTDDGNETPTATLYWGLTDGGTDPGMWDTTVGFGTQGGSFSTTLTTLAPNTQYFFRTYAENSSGGTWSTLTETFTTNATTGVTGTLDSSSFTWNYEMDVNPSTQDLDAAGSATDWFANTAGGVTIPQDYSGGLAMSNASPGGPAPELESVTVSYDDVTGDATLNWTLSAPGAVDVESTDDPSLPFNFLSNVASGTTTFTDLGVGGIFDKYFYKVVPLATVSTPEVLFRTDFGGSIQRQQLIGTDFTMEMGIRIIGPKDGGDVGIFGAAIDPGGFSSAFRLNIDEMDVSQNAAGDDLTVTGDNTDVIHVYRVAFSYNDNRWWVWRDGVLIYGADLATGVVGGNPQFNDNGSSFLGDFTGSLSGEWEVDFIRLHNAAVGPTP